VLVSPYCGAEPVGLEALVALGEGLYGDADPSADAAPSVDLLGLERTPDGFVLSIALPLARRDDVDLARSGDELVVTVGGHRRVLALPSALKRCTVAGATLVDGRLRVRFEPDPDLWMRR
jgi:arsenite-transporting ATPase